MPLGPGVDIDSVEFDPPDLDARFVRTVQLDQSRKGDMDPVLEKGVLQLLGEETFALHLSEGHVLNAITPGFDDLNAALDAETIGDQDRDPPRLPQGEVGAPGSEA